MYVLIGPADRLKSAERVVGGVAGRSASGGVEIVCCIEIVCYSQVRATRHQLQHTIFQSPEPPNVIFIFP